MTDRIVLDGMVFQGTHGVYTDEQQTPQPFEVDVVLALNLQPAGLSDDLAKTIDYGGSSRPAARSSSRRAFELIEALAEAIAHEILADDPADEVTVRVRKPQVELGGTLAQRGRRDPPAPDRLTRPRARGLEVLRVVSRA